MGTTQSVANLLYRWPPSDRGGFDARVYELFNWQLSPQHVGSVSEQGGIQRISFARGNALLELLSLVFRGVMAVFSGQQEVLRSTAGSEIRPKGWGPTPS